MDLNSAAHDWREHGFVVLPGYLSGEALDHAATELEVMAPTAYGFHEGDDPRRARYLGAEFAGIDNFPFASTGISLLAVHERLVTLATALLEDHDLRIYSAEFWAKYTGAADYGQALHRDYLDHTLVVPSDAINYRQLEMFIYLDDVQEELGPPHLVPKTFTKNIEAKPNWFPRRSTVDHDEASFVAPASTALYEHEVSATGPAGTVVAFELGTFHRGTALTRERGARYTMHVNYRRTAAEWGGRHGWAGRSHEPAWYRFVERATPRQLELFGFPAQGHPYWTPQTLAGTALRYPGLDLSPWTGAS